MCLRKQREKGERGGMRIRDGPRLFKKNHRTIRKRVALNRHLTLSLTVEASAVIEVQVLHAFGEDECTDITCGKRGGEK